MSTYRNNWSNDEVFGIEFLFSILLSVVYYIAIIDIRLEKEEIFPFLIASYNAVLAIAFPSFSGGNMLKLFAGLNKDVGFVLCSIGGQVLGILLGAALYRFFLCDNEAMEKKERAVNAHETKQMGL